MTTPVLPEFTLTCSTRRRACVIDSGLALSIYGLPIAKQLGDWMELWIVREFWQMIEEHALSRSARSQLTPALERALQEWERLRQHVDSHHRPVNVLADVLGESSLPGNSDPDLLWRWERLAQALDRQVEARNLRLDPHRMASRDLVALAAARSACILTLRSLPESPAPPPLCLELDQWGIPSQAMTPADSWVGLEATALSQLFVHAGLAALLWSGMDLCVVHVFAPAASTLGAARPWPDDGYAHPSREEEGDCGVGNDSLWEGARAFWYPLAGSASALSPALLPTLA